MVVESPAFEEEGPRDVKVVNLFDNSSVFLAGGKERSMRFDWAWLELSRSNTQRDRWSISPLIAPMALKWVGFIGEINVIRLSVIRALLEQYTEMHSISHVNSALVYGASVWGWRDVEWSCHFIFVWEWNRWDSKCRMWHVIGIWRCVHQKR